MCVCVCVCVRVTMSCSVFAHLKCTIYTGKSCTLQFMEQDWTIGDNHSRCHALTYANTHARTHARTHAWTIGDTHARTHKSTPFHIHPIFSLYLHIFVCIVGNGTRNMLWGLIHRWLHSLLSVKFSVWQTPTNKNKCKHTHLYTRNPHTQETYWRVSTLHLFGCFLVCVR